MTEREAMPWVALLGLMVDGPVSEREPSIRGMVRSVDPTTADSDGRARVWRDGILARVENPSGRPMLIVGSERAWRFGERQPVPLETASVEARTNIHGAGLLWRRPAQSFLGNDCARPTGLIGATTFLGRPAWTVELAPPAHKPYPVQLVVDAETGIVLQQRNDGFGSMSEWTEFVVGEPLNASLFTWEGPVRLEADARAAGEAEHEADMERRRDWFTANVAPLPLPVRVNAGVHVHVFDPSTGAFEASIEAGGLGTLARRPRSSTPWNLRWHQVQHRWTDDECDWALSVYDTGFSEDGLAVLRQHLSGTPPPSAQGRWVTSDGQPGSVGQPEFAFQHGAHDRMSERRGDSDFLAAAWADGRTQVVVTRDMELSTAANGTRLATVPPAEAPGGARMLLGEAEGVISFLVIEDTGTASGDGPDTTGSDGSTGDTRIFASLRSVATTLSRVDASLAVHAVALAQWHARHHRCAVCGNETAVAQAGESRRCPHCSAQHFPRTDPAVIMLVLDDDDRCLLGHNAARDATWYSTLAGFVEPGESLEDAVVREVAEETGVAVDSVSYFGSQPWPFPSSLMLGFRAHATATAIAVDGVEITKARWFTREELRHEVEAGDLVIPSTISISGALVQSWYGAELPLGPPSGPPT